MADPTAKELMPPLPARAPVDIPALQGFLASIGSVAGPELILYPNRPLFHYTNLEGLLGILQGDELWLTHSRYSNDEEEMTHGFAVVHEAIDRALRDAGPKLAYVERLKALVGERTQEGVYVCSFCARDDLLSQWRAYGANGRGVSIEIDPQGFASIAGADCPHGLLRLWRIVYKPETQSRIVQSAIEHVYATGQTSDAESLAQRAADAINFFVPTFKNAAFEEEAESRLIFTPHPNCRVRPRFRVGRGLLAPYFGLRDVSGHPPAPPLLPSHPPAPPLLPVRGITVGPGPDKNLIVESVRLLLHETGHPAVPIRASETPYRG